MKKFKCNGCHNECSILNDNGFSPLMCPYFPDRIAHWQLIEEEKEAVTDCNQLPKLTVEVFDHPDCPAWAKYAAVDKCGTAWFHECEPEIIEYLWWSKSQDELCHIHKKFDNSDWQNSLIERPAKALPDWCKVGKHGYDNEQQRYFEIVNIDEKFVDIEYLDDGIGATCSYADIQQCSEARKRPFNEKEMKELVGRIFTTVDGDASIATDFDSILKALCIYGEWFKSKELADSVWQLDGNPCYKLKHLENGEWVE